MRVEPAILLGCVAFLAGCATPVPMPGLAGGYTTAQMSSAGQSLQQSQAAGMADAGRPGDASMSCDAIQAEVMMISQDPVYQNMIAKMTSGSAKLKTDMDAAEKKAALRGASDVAAGNRLSGQSNTLAMQSASDMQAAMPQIMRTQRLTELGQKKNCAFLKSQKQ